MIEIFMGGIRLNGNIELQELDIRFILQNKRWHSSAGRAADL
jgi:hypothetical protein